jgi:hypothetical protein
MPTPSKTKKREEFMAMVRRAGPLPTSALASCDPLDTPSDDAARVAQSLIGGLPSSEGRGAERVERLAQKLRQLQLLDSEETPQRRKSHG